MFDYYHLTIRWVVATAYELWILKSITVAISCSKRSCEVSRSAWNQAYFYEIYVFRYIDYGPI